MTKVGVLP